MSGSPLLLPEYPLLVFPTLAAELGVNEAIVLQQIYYWSQKKEPDENGEVWVYNTVEAWTAQFPWMSERTLRRAVRTLRDGGQISVRQQGVDRTNHYRVNLENVPHSQAVSLAASSGQSGRLTNKTETSSERTPISPGKKKVGKKAVTDEELSLAAAVVEQFNSSAGTRLSVEAHLTPIVGRIRERPKLTADHHCKIIEAVFAGEHWWRDPPDPRIIYGNAAQFERSIEVARKWVGKPKNVANAEFHRIRREQGLE